MVLALFHVHDSVGGKQICSDIKIKIVVKVYTIRPVL